MGVCGIVVQCLAIALAGDRFSHAQTTTDPEVAILHCQKAVAEAEVRVADTRVGILTLRIQGLRKLLETGNASWLEVAAAEAKLCEATSFAAASKRFRSGLLLLETDTGPAELTIHFRLPGSKAILGWVNVSDIPDLLRTAFLELNAEFQETNTAQVERQLRRRVADVGTLLEQGYASRQEMFNAEQQLFDFLADEELRTVNAQQSRIRRQMTQLVLEKHVAMVASHTVACGSAFNDSINSPPAID